MRWRHSRKLFVAALGMRKVVCVAALLLVPVIAATANPDLRAFADCISASGAKYYAAHWCPYCKKQNALFGRDWVFLPYIECSSKPGKRQLSRCSHISGYPTWVFADGSKGALMSLAALSSRTGCALEEKNYFVD